ncbi:beaten path Ia [Haematobia irritans]|uniref:beaten path Ia n=1 Tax=Haematobia irritans TaxID=7368 RepID=UPI003F4F879C
MQRSQILLQLLWIVLMTIFTRDTLALRDVRVKVPHAARRGQRITLKCHYDIEDDTLYSVKWYKGRREFYSYTPNENPALKVFQIPGVRVDRLASNETQLVLESASMATGGKYSCEVSADAPSFHTLIAAAELDVVELPHNPPVITGMRARYHVGDILRGNCTSRHSRPAANLTWTVNNEEVHPSYVRHYKIHKDSRNDMQTATIGLHFVINDYHFENGKLKIRCIAEIGDIYHKSSEKTLLDIEYHHKYLTSNTVNMIPTDNDHDYDQYALQDGEMLRKEDTYFTQIQDFFNNFMTSNDAETSAWSSASSTNSLQFLTCIPSLLLTSFLHLCWHLRTTRLQFS